MARYELVDEASPRYELVEDASPSSRPMPANAGMASFLSSAAGLPVDTVERVVNLGLAGFGSAANALGRPDLAPELLRGSFGGSESIRRGLRATGEPGLSPDDPSTTKMGEAQYKLMSRGGFIPGALLPAAGSMVAEEIGGPEWAGVGAMAPQAAIQGFNAARAPTLARQQAENIIRDKTLSQGREEGYVVPPSASGGGFMSRRLESFGGKAATAQDAAIKNQQVTNELARRELGLPTNTPVTTQTLANLRRTEAAPYREVAKMSPVASKALERLQDVRHESKLAWNEFNRQGNRTAFKEAKKFDAQGQALEKVIEREATKAGNPQLLAELKAARVQIAKAHEVEKALNVGTGDVSATVLGKMLDSGKPLSGGLETAGRFQQAFPHYMREGVQQPGISALEPAFAAALGLGGFGALGPLGVPLAALPFMRGPARSMMLSEPYQNAVMPSYGPAINAAPNAQLLYQLGIIQNQEGGGLYP